MSGKTRARDAEGDETRAPYANRPEDDPGAGQPCRTDRWCPRHDRPQQRRHGQAAQRDLDRVEAEGDGDSRWPAIPECAVLEQDTIPYAAIRETLVRHPQAEQLLKELQNQAGGNPTFIHTGDADVVSMTNLFNNADAVINDRPDIQILSGGYTLDNAGATAHLANQRDRAVREAMAGVDPRSVYMPEPNTFLRVGGDRLENDITFGVRDNPQGKELKYTDKEGRGLAQSAARNRPAENMDPVAFGAFDPSVSLETRADRLLKNYDPTGHPDRIPQSHADRETWKKQIQNYIQTFHPGVDPNKATGLTQLAFCSVVPVDPKVKKNIEQELGGDQSTLIKLAEATHKALAANPHTT